MSHDSAASDQYSAPYRFPYQIGLFLAANAIPDAYALIDGPDCVVRKSEWVFGKHDWNSTLMDVCGVHRVVSTLVNAERVIKDKGEELVRRIVTVSERADAGAVLICSMPHVTIIGTQYDKIIREMQPHVKAQLLEVPSRSLDGDWLEGYAETLNAIAANIDISGGSPDRKKVAVIGHLMDRTEQDHQANVAELRRMFEAMGLELVSVWLDGGRFETLRHVKDAGTIVAFPLGRAAARAVADRTGAEVVEVDLPFGLGRTQRMLRRVGRKAGRLAEAEALIDRELGRLVPRLEWVLRHVFVGKKIVFSGAPDLFGGLLQITSELGVEVAHLASPSGKRHLKEDLETEFGDLPPMLFAPTQRYLERQLRPLLDSDVDLAIGDTQFCDAAASRVPVMEFGFPSHFRHALSDRPHLGFSGWICFVDEMAEALSRGARSIKFMKRDQGRRNDASIPLSMIAPFLDKLQGNEKKEHLAQELKMLVERARNGTLQQEAPVHEYVRDAEDVELDPAIVPDELAAE